MPFLIRIFSKSLLINTILWILVILFQLLEILTIEITVFGLGYPLGEILFFLITWLIILLIVTPFEGRD